MSSELRGVFDNNVLISAALLGGIPRQAFDKLLDDGTVEINETITVCRDPKDDRLLELAVCGNANFLVTGDKDLLVLNQFSEVEIITPRDFLKKIF